MVKVQAYAGTDGVVISLTHEECEELVNLDEELMQVIIPLQVTRYFTKDGIYSRLLDSVKELKGES